jgi:hypothetical protein
MDPCSDRQKKLFLQLSLYGQQRKGLCRRLRICLRFTGPRQELEGYDEWIDRFVYHEYGSRRQRECICWRCIESAAIGGFSGRWENFSDGYPGTFTMCLGVSAAGYVYAGTQSYGMYKTGSPVHPRIKEVPLPPPPPPPVYFFDLQQNYPNPFNGSTQLEYALPKRSTVNISIFDILGRRVAVLVSEEQPDGRYTIAWQPKQEATGMYYCTLTIRDGSRTYSKTVKILYVR